MFVPLVAILKCTWMHFLLVALIYEFVFWYLEILALTFRFCVQRCLPGVRVFVGGINFESCAAAPTVMSEITSWTAQGQKLQSLSGSLACCAQEPSFSFIMSLTYRPSGRQLPLLTPPLISWEPPPTKNITPSFLHTDLWGQAKTPPSLPMITNLLMLNDGLIKRFKYKSKLMC